MKCTVNVGDENEPDEGCIGIQYSNAQTEYYIYTTPRLKEGVDPTGNLTTENVEPLEIDFIVFDSATGEICYSKNLREIYLNSASGRGIGGTEAAKANGYALDTNFDNWFSADSYIRLSGCGCIHTTPPTIMGPPLLNDHTEWRFMISTLLKGSDTSRYKPGFYISTLKGEKAFGYTTSYNGFCSHGVGASTGDGKNYPAWREGSTDGSMSAIATLDNVISVGACSATERFGTLNGNNYESGLQPGEIWPYSSYGSNTHTGERLPHVVAPGYQITSAANRYYRISYGAASASAEVNGESHYWINETGTSMASPFVAGTIALWLQADPELTVDDVKDILKNTNAYPEEIAALPENDERRMRWGGGMIQPLSGLKYVLANKAPTGIISTGIDNRLLVEQSSSEVKVFVAGAGKISARIYSLSGVQVASASARTNELSVSLGEAQKGIYILEVTADDSRDIRKIAVR